MEGVGEHAFRGMGWARVAGEGRELGDGDAVCSEEEVQGPMGLHMRLGWPDAVCDAASPPCVPGFLLWTAW